MRKTLSYRVSGVRPITPHGTKIAPSSFSVHDGPGMEGHPSIDISAVGSLGLGEIPPFRCFRGE